MKSLMLKYKWMCVAVICCAMFAACEPTGVDTSASDKNLITFGGRKNAYMTQIDNPNAKMWGYYVNDGETTWVFGSEASNTLSGVDSKVYEKEENGTTKWVIDIASPTKYWTTGTYDFFSLYSEGGDIPAMTRKNNLPTFTYDIESQHELRLATATVDATNTYDEAVPFQFNHLLSKIKFQGFSTDAKQEVTLKTITISSVAHTATYTIAADGTVGLTLSDDDADIQPLGTTGEFSLTGEANLVMEKVVFPQNVEDKSIEFKVTYVTSSGNNEKSAFLPATTWTAGNSYLYKFYIQPSGPIIFSGVTISEWETDDTASGNLIFDCD